MTPRPHGCGVGLEQKKGAPMLPSLLVSPFGNHAQPSCDSATLLPHLRPNSSKAKPDPTCCLLGMSHHSSDGLSSSLWISLLTPCLEAPLMNPTFSNSSLIFSRDPPAQVACWLAHDVLQARARAPFVLIELLQTATHLHRLYDNSRCLWSPSRPSAASPLLTPTSHSHVWL